MKRIIFILVFIQGLYLRYSYAQPFYHVGTGTNDAILSLYGDSVSNILYVGGQFSQAGNINCAYIATWNGMAWDSTFNQLGFVRTIEKFNNEIYIGGDIGWYDSVGNIIAPYVAKWDSSLEAWVDFGANANTATYGLYAYNNSLYIAGQFDTIGGIYSSKIARYDGTNWYSIPPMDTNGGGWAIVCSFFYNGDLYVGGNFLGTAGPNMKDIARWNGSQWIPVGNGMSGGITWVLDFTTYQGKLIVAGRFRTATGDPGNSIAAWDGTQWTQLGTGMTTGEVKAVTVYNGELWAGGVFFDAGGIPVTHLAKWNGTQWQSLGITLDNAVTSLAILGNDLYIAGGFKTMNGDTVNHIIRYNSLTGFETLYPNEKEFQITPNPNNGNFSLTSLFYPIESIRLFDLSGRVVFSKDKILSNSYQCKLNSPGGIYIAEVFINGNAYRSKILLMH